MAHHHHTSTTAQPTSGSQTLTLQTPQEGPAPSATLRLRAVPDEPPQRVRWAEDVVDNEHLNKKSSKVCCIYHKPKEDGESSGSDSDSSSSDEGEDSEPDLSRAQKAGGGGKGKGKGRAHRKPSPNAYERQPKHGGKKAG